MNPLILGSVFQLGKDLIDRFIPDKSEAARVEAEFLRMAAQGELQQVIAQLEINAKEAAHPSVFVAGWRPAFGWAGCAGFVYAVIVQPMLAWWAATKGLPTPPELNMDLLWVVITGMLGIGGLRTFEKSKGVSK